VCARGGLVQATRASEGRLGAGLAGWATAWRKRRPGGLWHAGKEKAKRAAQEEKQAKRAPRVGGKGWVDWENRN
jgi:hypothetical protein